MCESCVCMSFYTIKLSLSFNIIVHPERQIVSLSCCSKPMHFFNILYNNINIISLFRILEMHI